MWEFDNNRAPDVGTHEPLIARRGFRFHSIGDEKDGNDRRAERQGDEYAVDQEARRRAVDAEHPPQRGDANDRNTDGEPMQYRDQLLGRRHGHLKTASAIRAGGGYLYDGVQIYPPWVRKRTDFTQCPAGTYIRCQILPHSASGAARLVTIVGFNQRHAEAQ